MFKIIFSFQSGKKHFGDYDIPGANMDAFTARMKELPDDIFEIHQIFAKSLPAFHEGQNGVLLVIFFDLLQVIS